LKFVFSLLFILISFAGFGQKLTLNGKVTTGGQPLAYATLQLKTADSTILSYTNSDTNGLFVLEANLGGAKFIYLIASYIGLKTDTLKLESSTFNGNVISHNFELLDDPKQLEQINIKAEKPTVAIHNDTTSFNVAKLTTAEDKNIESVIRKMPGMSVSKDGTITYNQQKITKVLLEGDDMTGENYKTITQNLKPQLVEQVQAIENYIEDDLLNGIISSDEVVLNLKLKNNKSILGSADLAVGINKRNDVSANVVSLYKRIKAFSYISNNNTGKYQEDLLSLNSKTAYNNSNGKLINHAIGDTNPFDNNNFRLNNTLSGSLSAVSHANKNLKLTFGAYAIRNKLSDERSNTQIFLGPEPITTEDRETRSSNDKNYQIELGVQQRIGRASSLSSAISYTFKPSTYASLDTSFFNAETENLVNQSQEDKVKSFKGEISYVQKANASTAFVATMTTLNQKIEQSYGSISDLYSQIPLFNGAKNLLQNASNTLNTVTVDAQLLKKSGYNYFYLNGGGNIKQTQTFTNLYRVDNFNQTLLGEDFQNDVVTDSRLLYLAAKYTFDNKIIKVQGLLRGNIKHISVYEQDSTYFYLQPELNITAKLSDYQQLSLNYKIQNTSTDDFDYYKNSLVTDVRNINTGLDRIYYFNSHIIRAYYNNRSFSDKYFSFQLSGNASYSASGFLTANYFDNTLFYTQLDFYKGIKKLGGNAVFQKFIPVISTDFTLNFGRSKTNYYASISNQINNYTNFNNAFDFKLSTGFKFPLNFSGQFQYIKDATYLADNRINNNIVRKYSAASRIKFGGGLTQLVSFDLYQLNKTNYHILNSELIYQPKNTRLKYSIIGKNLFDVKTLVNNYVSNVVKSTSSASLLGRYVMFNLSLAIGQ